MIFWNNSKPLLLRCFHEIYRDSFIERNLFSIQLEEEVEKILEKGVIYILKNSTPFSKCHSHGSNYMPQNKNFPKRVFLCSIIHCLKKRDVLVTFYARYGAKLWLNNNCILIQGEDGNRSCNTQIRLNKGVNYLIVEFCTDLTQHFMVHLTPINKIERNRKISLLHLSLNSDLPQFLHQNKYYTNCSEYKIMLLGDEKKYSPITKIELKSPQSPNLNIQLNAKLNTPIIFKIPPPENNCFRRNIQIIYTFKKIDQTSVTNTYNFISNDDETAQQEILNEANELLQTDSMFVDALYVKIKHAQQLMEESKKVYLYWELNSIKDMSEKIKNKTFSRENILFPENGLLLFNSKLDDRIIRIQSKIPSSAKKFQKNYPVIIFATSGEYSSELSLISNSALCEECLLFTITTRGMTSGSYIGESSFFEIYNWILQNYPIDTSRVYLCGFSAGAYSAYTLAINHPDLFAGLLTIGGLPDFRLCDNLNNIPVYNISSSTDYATKGMDDRFKTSMKNNKNFSLYHLNTIIHVLLGHFLGHPNIIRKLLSNKSRKYPNEIWFNTDRNWHGKCYWITIHQIINFGELAMIYAKIKNSHKITINISNAKIISIDIPPVINKKRFDIYMNHTTFHFYNVKIDRLFFVQNDTGIWENVTHLPPINYRLGSGILAIYYGPLGIIIPHESYNDFIDVARKWASPKVMAFTTNVNTIYPIYDSYNIPQSIFNKNILLFELAGTSQLKEFNEKISFLVTCDTDGYTYLGNKVYGDYISFQCINNPLTTRKTIVKISTNNVELLKQCIFTRQLILPSFIGGLHPFLNREILIYYNKKFWGTYVAGHPLEEIL